MSDEAASAKRPRFAAASEEDAAKLMECPVCYEIPRDGVMIECRNGHVVCGSCKATLGQDAKCPEGRCDYDNPPRRNVALGNVINGLFNRRSCKYASSGCSFGGLRAEVRTHEARCAHRVVPCPACTEPFPANQVDEHFKKKHESSSSTNDAVLQKQPWTGPGRGDWEGATSFRTPAGTMFACAQKNGELVYVYLVALADGDEPENLKCRIKMGNSEHSVKSVAPVYPIDWSKQRIMADPRCTRISAWSFDQMSEDHADQQQSLRGADSLARATTVFDIERGEWPKLPITRM